MRVASIFLSGGLFGAGLTVSGMVNPARVQNFLDPLGRWDATLILVMGAGLIVTFLGYRLVFGRVRPLFADGFTLPTATGIDSKLMAGAAIFGIGWGLSGICPGPAVAGLVFGAWQSYLFVACMAAGMVLARLATRHQPSARELAEVEG